MRHMLIHLLNYAVLKCPVISASARIRSGHSVCHSMKEDSRFRGNNDLSQYNEGNVKNVNTTH